MNIEILTHLIINLLAVMVNNENPNGNRQITTSNQML